MKLDRFEPGEIRHRPAVAAQPETVVSETSGNITTNTFTAASKGSPAMFLTRHFICFSHEVGGEEIPNAITIETAVPSEKTTSYSAVEDDAARQLPALLRGLADLLEADIERAASEQAARMQD